MTREEIQIQYLHLLDEYMAEEKSITDRAKSSGTWKSGIDGNRNLFADARKKFDEKVNALKLLIDA